MHRVLVALVVLATAAHAETDKEYFARAMRIEASAIQSVETFRIVNAGAYDRLIVGRYKQREWAHNTALLMRCDRKQCWGQYISLGNGQLDLLGAIDLAGAPRPFPRDARSKYDDRAFDAGKRAKWPALVARVTTREHGKAQSRYGGEVEGENRHSELYVISLAKADQESPVVLRTIVDEHNATGAGFSLSFAVDKDGLLLATEQWSPENRSTCIPPDPVTVHYKLDKGRRFQRATDLGHRGCGSR